MCERAKDENLTKFWFRQYIQDPFKVLSFGALCAILWLYVDSQNKQASFFADFKEQSVQQLQDVKAQSAQQMQDMRDQNKILLERIEAETKAMNSVANRLDLISNRLEHLEREHENFRRTNE